MMKSPKRELVRAECTEDVIEDCGTYTLRISMRKVIPHERCTVLSYSMRMDQRRDPPPLHGAVLVLVLHSSVSIYHW